MEFTKIFSPADFFPFVATYGLGTVLSVIMVLYVLRENTKREERLINIVEKHLVSLHDQMLQVMQNDINARKSFENIESNIKEHREDNKELIKIIEHIKHFMDLIISQERIKTVKHANKTTD